LKATGGTVLCFVPGAFDIHRAIADLSARGAGSDADLLPMHGSLDSAAQDAALRAPPALRRRIVIATNIAETSVTVPGVTAVVDSGLHKVARYDADRGIDSLDVERITADAAEQRAGRAGRVAPGRVRRLWDARDRLRPHREPELFRVDLSATLLDLIAWGGDPANFEWFDRPREDAVEAGLALLGRLGAIRDGKLTDVGDRMRRIPLHPRLARMLVEAGGAPEVAKACALLSERHFLPPRRASTTSDLLSAIDEWVAVPPHVQRVAREIERMAAAIDNAAPNARARNVRRSRAGHGVPEGQLFDVEFRRAVLAGYPDRVAERREPRSTRVRLASGTGAVVAPESGVIEGEFLVALDVQQVSFGGSRPALAGTGRAADPRRVDADARIRVASRVEREWLTATATDLVHRFDPKSGTVKAWSVDRYDALVLAERAGTPDPEVVGRLLANAWMKRGPRDVDEQFLRRLRFAGQPADLEVLVRTAAAGARTLAEVDLRRALGPETLRALDQDAPETIPIPSGRTARLEYDADGGVSASVKLQELFGLADTPRIGRRREPLLLALVAPNGHPVQLTRDLRSFWDRTYPIVRKELRGRYPKHPWPDDPWNATPTARTVTKARR